MGNAIAPSAAVEGIAVMVTPALFILGSASLVASALVRMACVVDRARVLAAVAQEGSWEKLGATPAQLGAWLERHARRAHHAERSIVLLYAAVVVFVATCLPSRSTERLAGYWTGCPSCWRSRGRCSCSAAASGWSPSHV